MPSDSHTKNCNFWRVLPSSQLGCLSKPWLPQCFCRPVASKNKVFWLHRDSLATFKKDRLKVCELQTGSQINETQEFQIFDWICIPLNFSVNQQLFGEKDSLKTLQKVSCYHDKVETTSVAWTKVQFRLNKSSV